MKARFIIIRRSDDTGISAALDGWIDHRAAGERMIRDLQRQANAAGSAVTYRLAETLHPRGRLADRKQR